MNDEFGDEEKLRRDQSKYMQVVQGMELRLRLMQREISQLDIYH